MENSGRFGEAFGTEIPPEAPTASSNGTQQPHVQIPPPPPPLLPTELGDMLVGIRHDMGGLIARTDQLEARISRTDRQVLMVIGMLTVVLWTVKQLADKVPMEAINAVDPA